MCVCNCETVFVCVCEREREYVSTGWADEDLSP